MATPALHFMNASRSLENGMQLDLTDAERSAEKLPAEPTTDAGLAADRAQRLKLLKTRMQILAAEKLTEDDERGGNGIGFDEIRQAAEIRGWIQDAALSGHDRSLSFGSALMRAAGGYAAGTKVSKCASAHGRIIRLWKLTQPGEKAARDSQ